jgi:RNA polymerase sigma-70 factor, ECF subfamily
MKNHTSVIKLIERAQQGDTEELNRLADAVKVRLYEYTVRMTLDEQLAEDIVQESLLTMVQGIGGLRDSRQFWPWLMKIATNKVRHYYRRNGRRSVLLSKCSPPSSSDAQDAVADVISKEIRQIVLSAMHRLPLEHRLILNMRCYEEMSFTEIAEALDCRKFKARALFAKAKRTLGKNLAQSGLGKASLLGALVIYGKITATSEATGLATSVATASLKAGFLPTVAAVTTTRAALVAVATVGVSAAATSLVVDKPGGDGFLVVGSPQKVSAVEVQDLQTHQQHWYYYPPKSKGAVLIQIRASADGRQPEWHWFQNEEGNYSCSGRTVYRRNAHYYAPNLATMRLPTDSVAMRAFLDEVESSATPMERVRPTQKGLLVVAGTNDKGPFTHVRTGYDITDEQAFQNPWQHDVRITDRRDALHKEGWAYLRISGQIKGRAVTGAGRIPFVLAKRRTVSPWLRLAVEDAIILEDNSNAAVVCDSSGRIRHRFAGGTFLEGLSRPWEGLHTIDTLRRDAAGHHLWFETQNVVENQQADVVVTHENVRLVYTIDLDRDVVREIALYEGESEVGQLRLEYVKDLETQFDAINESGSTRRSRARQKRSDTLWLFSLLQAAWD